MTNLSPAQKGFIEDNFYEGQPDDALSRSSFERLTTPEELHYLADRHNWDDSVKLLHWIVESGYCSEATALQTFWLADPQSFQRFSLTATIKDVSENEVFNLVKTILRNFEQGFYKKADIPFDPTTYLDVEEPVPPIMRQATTGEEPYLYLDKRDVDSLFGEVLETRIRRCNSAIELFNMAAFTKPPGAAKLILQHPLCDKGIAILLFWRLKTFANMWYETDPMAKEIIGKVTRNDYPEVLGYDPKKDPDIKLNEPKPKWTIPAFMKRRI